MVISVVSPQLPVIIHVMIPKVSMPTILQVIDFIIERFLLSIIILISALLFLRASRLWSLPFGS